MANYLHQLQSRSKWASGVQPAGSWRGYTAGLVSLGRNHSLLLFCILNRWFACKACWEFQTAVCDFKRTNPPLYTFRYLQFVIINAGLFFFLIYFFFFFPTESFFFHSVISYISQNYFQDIWELVRWKLLRADDLLKLASVRKCIFPIKSFFHQYC